MGRHGCPCIVIYMACFTTRSCQKVSQGVFACSVWAMGFSEPKGKNIKSREHRGEMTG